MNSIPVNDVLNFFYSIFSKLFSFINANSLVKWFVFVPIAAAFLVLMFVGVMVVLVVSKIFSFILKGSY